MVKVLAKALLAPSSRHYLRSDVYTPAPTIEPLQLLPYLYLSIAIDWREILEVFNCVEKTVMIVDRRS